MEGGLAYDITLSDDANGVVVADALYIVKAEPLADVVTWVPTLPSAGRYQVYAKWTSDETRATDARYSIVHDGGTTAVTRNQRAGGGVWQYLGSYSFDPLLTPSVTLAANDNGSVAADAVRFVGGPAGATDVAYLHTDHLGTPQAMTDAGVQLLWWRDQTPFGQTVDTGGFSQTPIRFPGQVSDDESGLHYNYFRDYDPALGRYIQSDPIGLEGGLNTYGYVHGNPLRYVDPTGEAAVLVLPLIPAAIPAAKAAGAALYGGSALLAAILLNQALGDGDDAESNSQVSPLANQDSCTEGDQCKELGKRAKGQAKRVNEHVANEHFHSKPCINLNQTLSAAKALGCDMTTPNFSYAINVFNKVCTDPSRFPPPYAKPHGPPYEPY